MQMYRVKFACRKDGAVDMGDVVVCASSAESAPDVVAVALDLPPSCTTFDVSRVKPSLYQISRRDVPADLGPSVATYPSEDRHRYAVQASAYVWAVSEDSALKKLGKAVLSEVFGENRSQYKSVGMLQVLCDKLDESPRSPAIERNAIYTAPRIFSGGAARPG